MEPAQEHSPISPYQTLVQVWLVLLLLTAILVFVSTKYHEALSVWAMLTLTPLNEFLEQRRVFALEFRGNLSELRPVAHQLFDHRTQFR